MLRSHGATSAAVDSLFAYHQKTNPEPSAPARPSPGSETSHYLPPQAAVQQVCRPGARAQPRFQSSGGLISWSGLLLPFSGKKLERYTQFGTVCYPTRPPPKSYVKSWGVRPIFFFGGGGSGPPRPPVVAPMIRGPIYTIAYDLS